MRNTQKLDIHHRERQFNTAKTKLENGQDIIEDNKLLILQFIRDCRLGKTIKNRQKKSIGVARCLKYIHILKKISYRFNKPFKEVNQVDMEKFIESLEDDTFTYEIRKNGNSKSIISRKYANSTKLDYKNAIRKFYKWLLGDNKTYPELVDWIDTYEAAMEVPALARGEVEKLADASGIRDKAIIMFLFDSGARIEEALNIKIKDLSKDEDNYKVRIAVSKTKPRTIHLPICSKYLDLWLQEYSDKTDDSFLFPLTYDSIRMMLHRKSKAVLKGKRVTPHILRHSSATYYANHLSHFQLCYRYGWSMASNMPNRYLDREGIFETETTNKIQTNDVSNLEKQNQLLKEELANVKESNNELSIDLQQLKAKMSDISIGKEFLIQLCSIINSKVSTI